MNEYLKEIAVLCGIDVELNTHKARRTFGRTVTLNNDVQIHVIKELLDHQSIRRTEEYAITEKLTMGREMSQLKNRLDYCKIFILNFPDLKGEFSNRFMNDLKRLAMKHSLFNIFIKE